MLLLLPISKPCWTEAHTVHTLPAVNHPSPPHLMSLSLDDALGQVPDTWATV